MVQGTMACHEHHDPRRLPGRGAQAASAPPSSSILNAKVYTNTVKGIGQLSVRLRDADVLVLIRERTHISRAAAREAAQAQADLADRPGRRAHRRRGLHRAAASRSPRASGSPVAPAELTWALIMAAMRRLPQYISNLKHGAWQQSGLKSASMPPNFGLGMVLKGKTLGIWGYGKIGQLVAGYGKAFGMQVVVWGSERARAQAPSPTASRPRPKPRSVLRDRRRAVAAPAPERRDARHRQARRRCRA